MRLPHRRALLSVIAAAFAAAAVPVPTHQSSGAYVDVLAEALFIRPAYAGKRKKNRGDRDAFKDAAKQQKNNKGNGSSSNAVANAGGGKDKTSAPKVSDGDKKGAAGKPSKPVKADDDTDVGDAPAATVKDLFTKMAAPAAPAPRQRQRLKSKPQIEDFASVENDSHGSEIIATGMKAADVQKAKALGFTSVSAIGGVTKLAAPANMGRSVARDLLRAQGFPGGFEENHTYVIYAPSDGAEKSGPDSIPGPGVRTGQCRDDRCIGRSAICWNSDLATRARQIKIGIIDTPVDLDHPAFTGRKINIGSFLGGYARTAADWHGTAVLSLLSGSIDSGVPGLAPDAEYYVAETFRTDEQGTATTDTASILNALTWLDSQNVTLINMSFSGPKDVLVEKAIQSMRSRGVTFVAAAGNFGPTASPSYPAAYKEVIAVTAITKDGLNYIGANRGDYIDLAAPGVKIWTALPRRQGRLPHRHVLRGTVRDRYFGHDAQSEIGQESRDRGSPLGQDGRPRPAGI